MAARDNLINFNREIEQAILLNDGSALCGLLAPTNGNTLEAVTEFYRSGGPLPHVPDASWGCLSNLVRAKFLTVGAISIHNWVEASRQHNHGLSLYLDLLSVDTAWSAPVLWQLCEDARVIAWEADRQLGLKIRKPQKMLEVSQLLERALTIIGDKQCFADDASRSTNALIVVNHLLKLYFYINELDKCSGLLDLVRAGEISFDTVSVVQRATFKFYEGRLALYDQRYQEANEALSYALRCIPTSETTQRRRVLLFLIPAKILTGRLPSFNMLNVFQMHWFRPIVLAIRLGDVGMFDSALRKHREFFIRRGLYLTVLKMLPYVYRALIRKVVMLSRCNNIYLADISVALRATQMAVDVDQIQCTLTNLIHQNVIDGYVSSKMGVLHVRSLIHPGKPGVGNRISGKLLASQGLEGR